MREPLVWPGGTRHSASGLLVQIHTDEGVCRGRRGARTDAADDPDDHRRGARPVPDRPGSAARRVARAPAGGVHAQLEPDGRVRDRRRRDGPARPEGKGARHPGRGAARRLLPGPRLGRRLPLHRLARGERQQGRRLRRRGLHRAEAQGRTRLRAGSRHARGDPRPRRVRGEDPDRREHDLERPGGDQVDQGPRALRPPVRRATGARLRRAGPRPGAPLRRRADRCGRGVHRPALRARADQGRCVRRARRLSVRGGRAPAGAPDRRRSPRRPASGA